MIGFMFVLIGFAGFMGVLTALCFIVDMSDDPDDATKKAATETESPCKRFTEFQHDIPGQGKEKKEVVFAEENPMVAEPKVEVQEPKPVVEEPKAVIEEQKPVVKNDEHVDDLDAELERMKREMKF